MKKKLPAAKIKLPMPLVIVDDPLVIQLRGPYLQGIVRVG